MERKVNLREVRDQFYQYVLNEHQQDLQQILEDDSDTTKHIPVYVNFLTLSESCAVVADLLRTSGGQVLPALDLALTRAARHLYGQLTEAGHRQLALKTLLHVRLIELPVCAELQRSCVPRIEDEGQLLCVSGTVVRTGLPHLLDTTAYYCCNKCRHQFCVVAVYDQSYQTERPVRCPNPQPCRAGSGFTPVSVADFGAGGHAARDYQEIRLQEQVQKLDVGKIPRGLCVVLENDLVDSCKPGDDVIITGTVRQRWRSTARDCRPDIEMTLHANRVFVNNEQRTSLLLTDERRHCFQQFWHRHRHDPLAGRNRILQSFCCQIYGMYVVKLAVALTLMGGVRRTGGGSSTRGEPHLLLVGDPGTGKSQLLKYAARLCSRSVLTTGIGSTTAGLTCAAVKEGPEWQLEAGALVLADGGVCCIDEFNSVREVDKTSMHEAMEQQTISVAKAGMVCKLNTRCSILAAANPSAGVDWESGADVLSKLGLASPLLSRFDLILVLRDAHSQGWDKLVSGYILSGLDPLSGHGEAAADWNLETLQAYLAHVRTLRPEPDPRVATVLQTYYQVLRAQEAAGRSRTTVRLLESLLRLTQAHARLCCSAAAQLRDAVVAITLMEASLGGLGGGLLGPDGVGSILQTGFPENAASEYRAQCELILGRLGLDAMLEEELTSLDEQQRLASEDADANDEPPLAKRPVDEFRPVGPSIETEEAERLSRAPLPAADSRGQRLDGVGNCRHGLGGAGSRSQRLEGEANPRDGSSDAGGWGNSALDVVSVATVSAAGLDWRGPVRVPAGADDGCASVQPPRPPVVAGRSPLRQPVTSGADDGCASVQPPRPPVVAGRSPLRQPVTSGADDGCASVQPPRPPVVAGRSPLRQPVTGLQSRFTLIKRAAEKSGRSAMLSRTLDSLVEDMDDDFESSLRDMTNGAGTTRVRHCDTVRPMVQSGLNSKRKPSAKDETDAGGETRLPTGGGPAQPTQLLPAEGGPAQPTRLLPAEDGPAQPTRRLPAEGGRAQPTRRLPASTLDKLARFSVDRDSTREPATALPAAPGSDDPADSPPRDPMRPPAKRVRS